MAGRVDLDVAAEAAALTAALRALAPEPTVVPIIKTSRPFYGAKVGDLRRTAKDWRLAHRDASRARVAALADRLWHAGIREEQLVACFLLGGHREALAATQPSRVRDWTALLDNWETTDQLGMNVLGPLVALDPDQARLVEMRYFAGLTIEETAEALGVSEITVKREWLKAKAWLYRELTQGTGDEN